MRCLTVAKDDVASMRPGQRRILGVTAIMGDLCRSRRLACRRGKDHTEAARDAVGLVLIGR